MSIINNESLTWLDHFPTEIIFFISDYLSSNDIIYTFFNFNQRFNNMILQNYEDLNSLELPTTNFDFWKNILSIIGSQIESLNITSINLSISLKYFPNLKSIIIYSPFDFSHEELKLILEHKQFKHLYSLKIKQNKIFSELLFNNCLNNQDYILEKIFNNDNLLESFHYPLITSLFEDINIKQFKINFNLNSLTLNLTRFDDIFIFIEYVPNIEYLNIQCQPPYFYRNVKNKIKHKLKEFYLTLNGENNRQINWNQLITGIRQFSLSLICLSLNLINIEIKDIDRFPFNNIELELFLKSMFELKQFYLYAKLNEYSFNIDEILSKFNEEFWFNNNISFGMHRNYFYTLPFHFDYLQEFYEGFNGVKTNNQEILNINSRIWFNVKTIDLSLQSIYDFNFLKELKIKMPKLNKINCDGYYNSISNERKIFHNEKITLDNITTIHLTHYSIEDDTDLLISLLPNLKNLFLSSGKLPLFKTQLADILNKNIEQLYIDMTSELEQLIEINENYFWNVKYIYFRCLSSYISTPKWYADIIIKILNRSKNLKILIIYIPEITGDNAHSGNETRLREFMGYFDIYEINENFRLKYFKGYCLFSRIISDT